MRRPLGDALNTRRMARSPGRPVWGLVSVGLLLAGVLFAGVLVAGPGRAGAAPGDLDTGFSSDGKVTTDVGTVDAGRAVAVQPDGKIVVAGYSLNGPHNDLVVLRYDADGSLDTSFSGDGKVLVDIDSKNDFGYSVAVQSDGKIVVAGATATDSLGVLFDMAAVRLTTAGELDAGFGSGGVKTVGFGAGSEYAMSVALSSDGKIVLAGYGSNGSDFDVAVARLTSTGELDTSFSGDGKVLVPVGSGADYGNAVALAADGDVVVAGSSVGSTEDIAVVRLTSTGVLDTAFSGDGITTVAVGSGDDLARAVAIAADGDLIVAGTADVTAGSTTEDIAVVRLTPAGMLDTAFSGDGMTTVAVGSGDDEGRGLVVLDDGRIVVVGESHDGSSDDVAVVRLTSTGALDTGFSGDGKATIAVGSASDIGHAVALTADWRLVVAGSSTGTDDDVLVVSVDATAQPGTPTGLAATAGNGQVALSWTAPTVTGGSAITGYAVDSSVDGGSTWSAVTASTGSTITSHTVTGLTAGVAVTFRVSAVNVVGTGGPSGSASATPFGLPGAPTGLSAVAGAWQVAVSWTAPGDDGGSAITGYRIERSIDGATWSDLVADTASTATSHTAVGLTGGTAVRFRVSARTATGVGATGAMVTATPFRTPDAPAGLSAVAGVGRVTLTWAAPSVDGGSPVLRYEVRRSDVGGATTTLHTTTGPVVTATITGLTPGDQLRLSVVAVTSTGAGPASAIATSTPAAPTTTVSATTTTTTTTRAPTTTVAVTTTTTTRAPTTTVASTTTVATTVATTVPSGATTTIGTTTTTSRVPPTTAATTPLTTVPEVAELPGMVPPRPVYIG